MGHTAASAITHTRRPRTRRMLTHFSRASRPLSADAAEAALGLEGVAVGVAPDPNPPAAAIEAELRAVVRCVRPGVTPLGCGALPREPRLLVDDDVLVPAEMD